MANEIGNVIIPQHTDFNIKFQNITMDGSGFSFSIASGWIFAMGNSISGTPTVLKSSTGTLTSGNFIINGTDKSVSVLVRASELSYGYGEYFTQLYLVASGQRISHLPNYVHIRPAMSSSGV